MNGRDEGNQTTGESKENIYPYASIRLSPGDLLKRFSPCVLMPCYKRDLNNFKAVLIKEWQTKAPEDFNVFLDDILAGKCNIAVRLGPKSFDLCALDIDTNDRRLLDTLLEFCPRLADTLWTRGSTGCAIWFRAVNWPEWAKVWSGIKVPGMAGKKDVNDPVLEFRAGDRRYSLIWGKHIAGGLDYTVANDKPVLSFEFEVFKTLFRETTKAGWSGWPGVQAGRPSDGEGQWTNHPMQGWPVNAERRLQILEDLGYEILDVDNERGRVSVRCVNEKEHTDDTGERQAVIFIGTDSTGIVSYCCLHAHCKNRDEDTKAPSINQLETQKIKRAFAAAETIFYRYGEANVDITYIQGYQMMREKGEFFNLNKNVIRWREGWEEILPMNSNRLQASLNELGIQITRELRSGKIEPMKLTGSDANAFLDHPNYLNDYLERLKFVCPCQIPWWNATKRQSGWLSYGYNPELKCLCLSKEELEPMSGVQGLEYLEKGLLDFWKFETPEDKSRALCMVLSVAECLGQWYQDRGAMHLIVADRRQAGKTFLIKCIAAIYGIDVTLQEHQERSVDGLRERFNRALARGDFIYAVDNIRGEFDVPQFEVVATGSDQMDFRLPFGKAMTASIAQMVFFFCGNEGFKFTGDLASRLNVAKILYQPERIFEEEEGSLLSFIKEHGRVYRSAIAAILNDYAKAGARRRRSRANEFNFRFQDWTEMNNGLLELYGRPLLTGGLAERQMRAADSSYTFAEEAFAELEKAGFLDKRGLASTFGHFFVDIGLSMPWKTSNVRISDRALATRIGKLFNSLTPVREGLNRFGPGYVHVIEDSHAETKMYLVSRSETLPQNDEILEYDP